MDFKRASFCFLVGRFPVAPSSKSESNLRVLAYSFNFVWSSEDKEGSECCSKCSKCSVFVAPLIKAKIKNCAAGLRSIKEEPFKCKLLMIMMKIASGQLLSEDSRSNFLDPR